MNLLFEPAVYKLAANTASLLYQQWVKTRKVSEEIEKSQLSMPQLQSLSTNGLMKKVLELRAYSLELFHGIDIYQEELDATLERLQSSTEDAPDLLVTSTIQAIQTQLKTIADYRSELENGYISLLAHDYPIENMLREHYEHSMNLLQEEPKLFFEKNPKANDTRTTVNQTLVEFRTILVKERNKWAEQDAFSRRVMELSDALDKSYTQIAKNGHGLEEDLRKRHQEARDTLALSLDALKTEEKKSDLAKAKQVLIDLQVIANRIEQNQIELRKEENHKQQAKIDEDKRQALLEIEQRRRLRNLLILISLFIVIPFTLFLIGLGVLIWRFGNDLSNEVKIPFLGIPYSVLLWSALGSIASMLNWVNVYKEKQFQSSWGMFRWAITRPLIGIVLGLVIYLAASAGLLITVGEFSPKNYSLLWLFAFVGGFSDRVQQALINLIIGKVKFTSDEDMAGEHSINTTDDEHH